MPEMDSAIDVSSLDLEPTYTKLSRRVSSSLNRSFSSSWTRPAPMARTTTFVSPKALKPFNTEDIKILLLENVNNTGVELLKGQGYQITFLKSSLPEDDLIEKIRCGNAGRVHPFHKSR